LSVVFEKKSFSLPPKGRGFGGGRLPLPPPFSLLLPRVSSVEVVFVFASSKPVDDNDIGNRLFLLFNGVVVVIAMMMMMMMILCALLLFYSSLFILSFSSSKSSSSSRQKCRRPSSSSKSSSILGFWVLGFRVLGLEFRVYIRVLLLG